MQIFLFCVRICDCVAAYCQISLSHLCLACHCAVFNFVTYWLLSFC